MAPTDWDVVLDAGAMLGEGPVWVGERVWWVDIEGERIHHTDPATGSDEVIEVGEPIGAVIPRSGGGSVRGLADGVALCDAAGREERRLLIEADDAGARMNDARCDAAGRLFTGTMAHGDRRSALYRVDPDLTVATVFTGVGTSNGLGWSDDGTRMYYIDTPTMRVDVIDYDLATGGCENRRPLIEITGEQGRPDGMTVDGEGCLWVAFWDGWCIRRFDPDGTLITTVELPAARTTSCTFGGPGLDQLFVTSASTGLSEAQSAAQPHAGALFVVDPGVRGRPPAYFGG